MTGGRRAERRRERAIGRARAACGGMTLTHHARSRAAELGFHETDVFQCIARPEVTSPGGPNHAPGLVIYRRGLCAVVANPVQRQVVTVLLNLQREWTHGVDTRLTARAS